MRHDITHQAEAFAKGDSENVVVTDSLHMGNDPRFLSRLEPFRYFGVHVSRVESPGEAFDVLTPDCEATPVQENQLTFEFRTRSADDNWTVWEEVTADRLRQPFHLESPAVAWQYRVTFYANDFAQSPQIRRIRMITRPVRNLAGESPSALSIHTP